MTAKCRKQRNIRIDFLQWLDLGNNRQSHWGKARQKHIVTILDGETAVRGFSLFVSCFFPVNHSNQASADGRFPMTATATATPRFWLCTMASVRPVASTPTSSARWRWDGFPDDSSPFITQGVASSPWLPLKGRLFFILSTSYTVRLLESPWTNMQLIFFFIHRRKPAALTVSVTVTGTPVPAVHVSHVVQTCPSIRGP